MEYTSKHNQVLSKFQGVHKGKDAIIFATGPSLNKFEWTAQFADCITLGLNAIYQHNHIAQGLDYYMFGSGYHTNASHHNQINQLREENSDAVFLSSTFTAKHGDGRETGLGNITKTAALDLGAIPFEVGYPGYGPGIEWQQDIANKPFYGATIAQPATQFLLYTGVKKIYLVGCDLGNSYSDQYAVRVWTDAWKKLPSFLEKNYPQVQIVSVNPNGLVGVFDDLYT
jgi:hypothetical protein